MFCILLPPVCVKCYTRDYSTLTVNVHVTLQVLSNWCKKDESVYITEEKGIIGINFHQSKEAQFHDPQINGYYDVSPTRGRTIFLLLCRAVFIFHFFFFFLCGHHSCLRLSGCIY